MSRDMADLDPDFRALCYALLSACKARGVDMRPFFTARHPVEQGGLWRQSRSGSEVRAKIASLIGAGAPYLAQCIVDAGPQSGRWATNAIPGLSWHQWGLALDSYWLVDGAAEWDADATHNGVQGYAVYAEEAERLGLRSLRSIGDSPHVQQPKEGSPSSMGLVAVDAAMRKHFDQILIQARRSGAAPARDTSAFGGWMDEHHLWLLRWRDEQEASGEKLDIPALLAGCEEEGIPGSPEPARSLRWLEKRR